MCAAAAGSGPSNQLANLNLAQAQQTLDAIRSGVVPTDEAFVNLQGLLTSAFDYVLQDE